MLILKKPFDNIEVLQLAAALTWKWALNREAARKLQTLEGKVDARTREVERQTRHLDQAGAKLKKAQTQWLQTDEMAAVGPPATGVTHEVNDPIRFLTSNVEALASYSTDLKRVILAYDALVQGCLECDPDLTPKVETVREVRKAANVDRILSNLDVLAAASIEGAQRMGRIVENLGEFSCIDGPEPNDEDLNALIERAISAVSSELRHKAEVVRRLGRIPSVRCYGYRLSQAFFHLLVNAAQAIERRGTITVHTDREADRVAVEVIDTGRGIRPEHLDRIFEPFFTTKEAGPSTGDENSGVRVFCR